MQDLSLHLLDIAQNSIRAKASVIKITIKEDLKANKFSMMIEDNGTGMSAALTRQVTDPFVTTRTTRKVGLGLPLLKQNCIMSGGALEINSEEGKGTVVTAVMQYDHIDRLPIGDMASSMCVLIQANPTVDFIYTHYYNDQVFILSTREIKETLEDVPINEPEIAAWLRRYIAENLQAIRKNRED